MSQPLDELLADFNIEHSVEYVQSDTVGLMQDVIDARIQMCTNILTIALNGEETRKGILELFDGLLEFNLKYKAEGITPVSSGTLDFYTTGMPCPYRISLVCFDRAMFIRYLKPLVQ